jgi:hypothetical protein
MGVVPALLVEEKLVTYPSALLYVFIGLAIKALARDAESSDNISGRLCKVQTLSCEDASLVSLDLVITCIELL